MCVPYCDPGAVPSAPRGVGGGPGRAHGLPALRAQGSEWPVTWGLPRAVLAGWRERLVRRAYVAGPRSDLLSRPRST